MTTVNGADYRGAQNHTSPDGRGQPCLYWNQTQKHAYNTAKFPNGEWGLGSHSACRNPDGDVQPWCYVLETEEGIYWKYCDIPSCHMPGYIGCFLDSGNPPALSGSSGTSSKLTVQVCIRYCRKRGYKVTPPDPPRARQSPALGGGRAGGFNPSFPAVRRRGGRMRLLLRQRGGPAVGPARGGRGVRPGLLRQGQRAVRGGRPHRGLRRVCGGLPGELQCPLRGHLLPGFPGRLRPRQQLFLGPAPPGLQRRGAPLPDLRDPGPQRPAGAAGWAQPPPPGTV
ncbi:hypothetical protein KIL84_006298 [Mauremys mutica]|uniref:Kringle-containing protein marking the eye and the nose n=1 Tax=Mauremys mutica TaxID=74926 RepID=A0A9D3X0Z1_9SAUR|nr:hypothetical protein KIL84_006298 [Mauremys mutica]